VLACLAEHLAAYFLWFLLHDGNKKSYVKQKKLACLRVKHQFHVRTQTNEGGWVLVAKTFKAISYK